MRLVEKTRASIQISLVVVQLLLIGSFSFAQTNTLIPASFSFNFRSLFDRSIAVTNAVFEKEVFISGIPSAAQKQVFSLKLDGENYLLGTLKDFDSTEERVLGGRLDNTLWEVNPSCLVIYDQRLNKPTNNVSVVATESIMQMTANLFVNLGITEMLRGSAVWGNEQNRVIAQSTGGQDMVVDFEWDADLPKKASIKNNQGQEYAYVRYSYSPIFCNGRIPVGFTRFHSGAPSEEVGKVFTVRIKTLELVQGSIQLAAFDPQKLYNFKRIVFYSNNVMYWKGQGQISEPKRVITAEEAHKNMPKAVSEKTHRQARVVVIGLLGASAIGLIALLYKQNKKINI